MSRDSENLLSDHGHPLLYCQCGACAVERFRKYASRWMGQARTLPDSEHSRIKALWRWRGTIAA